MAAPIVIISDYGVGAGIAAVKGVCREYAYDSRVYDLTNDVAPLNIEYAGKLLADSMCAWPCGTVFLNLVDNGEKDRKYALMETEDGYKVVSPDNAALDAVAASHGIKEKKDVSSQVKEYALREKSALCHGRDIAYAAALVAAGRL